MIRAKMTAPNGRKMLIVGLSGENVARLAAGEPIFKQMEDAGFPGMDLVVLYGKTEDDAKASIDQLLTRVLPPERTEP